MDRPPATAKVADLTHSGITVARFVMMHFFGGSFLVLAGCLFFGWRAAGTILFVMTSAMAGLWVWRRIGQRGRLIRPGQTAWLALLLALTLPPQWFSHEPIGPDAVGAAPLWPLLVTAGLLLSATLWLLGGFASARVHPVVVVHLLVIAMAWDVSRPRTVLEPNDVIAGDVVRAPPLDADEPPMESPWFTRRDAALDTDFDAISAEPASHVLSVYSTGRPIGSASTRLDALIGDRLPPIQDLIVGGHPAAVGLGSAIAVIMGGLALIYRGLIDYRVPLLIVGTAWLTWAVAPVPLVVGPDGAEWTFAIAGSPQAGIAAGVTFVNYQLMAGPLLFVAFFIATSPGARPLNRRARWVYALLIGALSALAQLYVSVAQGPYLAMLVVCLVAPYLDRAFGPRVRV